MQKKLFLSCADEDHHLATQLRHFLLKRFPSLDIYYYRDADVGQRWAKRTKEALLQSEGLILLMSRWFKLKPWAYIEFASFWLRDLGNVYILQLPDSPTVDEMPLFRDYDVLSLDREHDQRQFLEGISNYVGSPTTVTQAEVENLRRSVAAGLSKSKQVFLKPRDVAFLARSCAADGDLDRYRHMLNMVHDDLILEELAIDFFGQDNFALGFDAVERINGVVRVREIFQRLLSTGFDTEEVRSRLLDILEQDNGELRNLGAHLIRMDLEYEDLFQSIVNRLANNAETRNLALRWMAKHGFDEGVVRIATRIRNDAELKNLLIRAIEHELHECEGFQTVLCRIKNEKHRKIVTEAMALSLGKK